MRRTLFSRIAVLAVALLLALPCLAEVRTEVPFPDLPGYVTLKCDFHMHTVYSDGHVLPPVRVREAWRNGLDAIAMTDHVEHQSRNEDLDKSNGNRSYELAKPEADRRHIILIRGGEITRIEPHGHFNVIGITDTRPINQKNNRDSVKEAIDQGAFLFWNHPPSKDLADEKASAPQLEYLEKGWLKGIEVFNGGRYYPHAHRWCLEHDLAMISNTDVHGLISEQYDPPSGDHRTMTLVFAKERSEEAIFEALHARRTVGFALNMLVGRQEWLEPLFEESVRVQRTKIAIAGRRGGLVPIHNACAVTFELEANGNADHVSFPGTFTLPAAKTVFLPLRAKGSLGEGATEAVSIPYTVKNALVAPEKGLDVTFDVEVSFSK